MRFEKWVGNAEIEEKAIHEEDDHWKLVGYAASFNNVDRVRDIILPGAFKASLERREREGDDLQLYYNHKVEDVPIGRIAKVYEDRKGLRYEAELPKDDEFVAKRIVPQIKRRALKSNSFGYRVVDSERQKGTGIRLLKAVDIVEISVVNTPANPAAVVEGIKGVVPYQALPVDRSASTWDAAAAYERVKSRFGDSDEIKQAFIFADPEGELDQKLLIADIDDNGRLVANRVALYKTASAVICGNANVPEEALDAVKGHIERYYEALNLGSPFASVSVGEWKVLDVGEREARLKGLGLTNDLAKALATTTLGQREADRKSSEREARLIEEQALLTHAVAAFSDLVTAIKSTKRTA